MYTEFLNFSLVQFENVLGSCRSGAEYKMPNLYFSGESNDVILVLYMLTLESRCIWCVVYFDQLSGVRSTGKLVNILFGGINQQ